MNNKIEITCPKCSKDNTVKLSDQLNCKHCEEEITGKKYIRKPWILIPTTLAVLSGVAGGVYIDEKIETDRYPISIEHSIVESCIHADGKIRNKKYVIEKKEICVCALENTIDEISYSEFQNKKYKFTTVFSQQIANCD